VWLLSLAVVSLTWAAGCAADSTSPQPDADAGVVEAGDAPPPTTGIAVLTWNLENFPLSGETSAFVSETVTELNADLVAVQEISDPAAFVAMAAALPAYDAVLNDDPDGFQRVGLLYNSERVSLTDVETLFDGYDDLCGAAGCWYPFPRPPLKAQVTATTATGATFDFIVVVVHLKAYLDAESEDRRRAACEALDGWIRDQLAGGAEQDVVVLGDFNDSLTDPPQNNVFQPFLQAPELYTFLTLPLEEAGQHTYISYDSFIDHVLITTDALAEYGDGVTTVLPLEAAYSGYQSTVSDHRPVLSLFMPD